MGQKCACKQLKHFREYEDAIAFAKEQAEILNVPLVDTCAIREAIKNPGKTCVTDPIVTNTGNHRPLEFLLNARIEVELLNVAGMLTSYAWETGAQMLEYASKELGNYYADYNTEIDRLFIGGRQSVQYKTLKELRVAVEAAYKKRLDKSDVF